jgi:hypothetical protein
VVPLEFMSVCPDPVTVSPTSSAEDDDTVAPPIPNGVNTQLRKILVCLGPSYSFFRGFEDPEDFDFDFDFRSVRPTEVGPEEVEEVDEEEVIRIP